MAKQVIFISVLVLSIFSSATAQFSIGAKAGIVSNDVAADLYIDAVSNAPQVLTSGLWGLQAELPVSQNLSFVSELYSTRKGFTIDEGTSFSVLGFDIPVGGRVTTSINYVESPLLLKAAIGSPTFQAYGVMGPSVGYATSATLQPTATLLIDFNLPTVDIDLSNSMYNRWDVSAVVGAGAQYKVGNGKIFGDLRYQIGLQDMINSSTIELGLKNRGIQFSAGYSYEF